MVREAVIALALLFVGGGPLLSAPLPPPSQAQATLMSDVNQTMVSGDRKALDRMFQAVPKLSINGAEIKPGARIADTDRIFGTTFGAQLVAMAAGQGRFVGLYRVSIVPVVGRTVGDCCVYPIVLKFEAPGNHLQAIDITTGLNVVYDPATGESR